MISENLMDGIPSLFGLKVFNTFCQDVEDENGNIVEIDVELLLIAQIRDGSKTRLTKNVTLAIVKTQEWCRGTLLLSRLLDEINEFDNAKKVRTA